MTARPSALTLSAARALLGVAPDADERELRKAYRETAKRAHPDRPTGDAALFRDVLAAYRLLQDHPFQPTTFPPTVSPGVPIADRVFLEIDIATAVAGGAEDLSIDGRHLRLKLPAGLRDGDRVRVEGVMFEVRLRVQNGALVRGDDIWLTGKVDPRVSGRGRSGRGRHPAGSALGLDLDEGRRAWPGAPAWPGPPGPRHAQGRRPVPAPGSRRSQRRKPGALTSEALRGRLGGLDSEKSAYPPSRDPRRATSPVLKKDANYIAHDLFARLDTLALMIVRD
jgi:curved DNA-binding protein